MVGELKPGTLLRGKWRLERFLGRGGMSSVYAATHRNGMRGAIKVLHRELNDNTVIKTRFLREGYVANKVDHPGAVKVLDDDATEDGLVFLVMELLEGETLKQRWVKSDRRLELSIALDIADQVLDVLESAHANRIVHRDLKPDNIFLVESGGTKILDFGIARVLEAATPGAADATSSAAMMGTPAFMPPEQALAHWHKVDARSDLFALGATLFTVLTGRLVHTGSTIPELLVAAATKQADSIGDLLPSLDEHIVAVIDRALRFDIEERWPSARAMRLELLQAKTKAAGRGTVRLELTAPRAPATSARPSEAGSTDGAVSLPLPTVEMQATKVEPRPPSAGGFESTPVRLQEAFRPEHVARLTGAARAAPPPRPRRWKVALGTALAVAAAALVVLSVAASRTPGSTTTSSQPPAGRSSLAPSAPAAPSPSAVAGTSGPDVTPVPSTSVAPIAIPSSLTTATAPPPIPSTARTVAPAGAPRPPPPPPPAVAPPPPKRCVQFDTFDGRKCVRYE